MLVLEIKYLFSFQIRPPESTTSFSKNSENVVTNQGQGYYK
jgi:hypothetical protein